MSFTINLLEFKKNVKHLKQLLLYVLKLPKDTKTPIQSE